MITDGLNPLTVLMFVGLVLGGAALAVLYVGARFTGHGALARLALRLGVGGVGLYALLFLVAALTSHDRELAPGEEKHICEIDCHLAYSVAGVKAEPAASGGVRYTVTVKVRFDEQTISSRRPKDAPLSPNRRYVALVDGAGHRYPGSTEGLTRRLIPGESYTTDLVFDVPADTRDWRLILRNDDPETSFLVGHENGALHGKTTFRLGAS